MRIVPKAVVPNIRPYDAFKRQRTNESGSYRLRQATMRLLAEGKASTDVVAKVFDLVIREMDGTGRITKGDIENVLPGFTVENGY